MNQMLRADAVAFGVRRMFVRDLVVNAQIGVFAEEKGRKQRVRINLDLAVKEDAVPEMTSRSRPAEHLANVVDYGRIVKDVYAVVGAGHVQLVETLADRLAEVCLVDRRVLSVWVTVEKLDVFPDAASVGVQIERHRRALKRERTAQGSPSKQAVS